MENIILWGIGIFIYLLIGYGVSFSVYSKTNYYADGYHVQHYPDGKLLSIFIWPMEFGVVIGRASLYYSKKLSRMKDSKTSPDAMTHHVFAIGEKVEEIEKTLRSIESRIPKTGSSS